MTFYYQTQTFNAEEFHFTLSSRSRLGGLVGREFAPSAEGWWYE